MSNLLIISPNLLLTSSPERNLCALLNRIPHFNSIYSSLTNEKETLMRNSIINHFNGKLFGFWWGKIGEDKSLPDVDLVFINKTEKACLITELKWFISPAEAREVIQRSEEIVKGIKQIRLLQDYFRQNPKQCFDKLNIDSSYKLYWAVISANSIGIVDAQDRAVPVISQKHVIELLDVYNSIKFVGELLRKRKHMPIEDEHYSVISSIISLDNWDLEWHSIKPKNTSRFRHT